MVGTASRAAPSLRLPWHMRPSARCCHCVAGSLKGFRVLPAAAAGCRWSAAAPARQVRRPSKANWTVPGCCRSMPSSLLAACSLPRAAAAQLLHQRMDGFGSGGGFHVAGEWASLQGGRGGERRGEGLSGGAGRRGVRGTLEWRPWPRQLTNRPVTCCRVFEEGERGCWRAADWVCRIRRETALPEGRSGAASCG